MEYRFETKCIYGNEKNFDQDKTGAISFPIYQTATYAHPEVGRSTGYDYSRLQNPTRQQVEKVVASLEGGIDALAFSSGMAAITAMMELFGPGDHLITDADLYGGSIRLFDNVCKKNGITFTHLDCSSVEIEGYIQENTKAIFIETPTNPMMNVIDIRKTAEIAKKHELLLIVDNTFILNNLPINLATALMTLTTAEMIGASSGMGYYVKVSLTYANYNKAIAGIIFIGVVVTILNIFIDLLKKKFVTWEY